MRHARHGELDVATVSYRRARGYSQDYAVMFLSSPAMIGSCLEACGLCLRRRRLHCREDGHEGTSLTGIDRLRSNHCSTAIEPSTVTGKLYDAVHIHIWNGTPSSASSKNGG